MKYFNILADFMEYKNDTQYPPEKMFTTEELLDITPRDVRSWMLYCTYGTANPTHEDYPIHARASTLLYWKKAISYFMPNKGGEWTVGPTGEGAGNPTKSPAVNGLINTVRREETRNTGAPSQANRAFTAGEFQQLLKLAGSIDGDTISRLRSVAMITFQYHLIARCDDVAHMRKDVFGASDQYPGFLCCKLRWSKNVLEERDCPLQLVAASMNPDYCVYVALALFLEKWIGAGEGAVSQWLFAEGSSDARSDCNTQQKEVDRCKRKYSNVLCTVMKSESFLPNGNPHEPLGSHSIRKSATTQSSRCGVHKDSIDYRARWKNRRMQDRYTDTQLDWPDIECCNKLCHGGMCLYQPRAGTGITNEWLARSVAPNISHLFGETVGAILGTALLWSCFEPTTIDRVPAEIRATVLERYRRQEIRLQDGVNPIERLEVIPSQVDGTVSLDTIPNSDNFGGDGEDPNGMGVGVGGSALYRASAEWRAALIAKASTTAVKVREMQQKQLADSTETKRALRRMEGMMRQLTRAPARIIGPAGAGAASGGVRARRGHPVEATAGTDPRPATLTSCPRELTALWDEWEIGIGGRKPARLFSPQERGRNGVKYKFQKRKVIWNVMERLIKTRDCTVGTCVGRINMAYGPVGNGPNCLSITELSKKMKADEKLGGHVHLR